MMKVIIVDDSSLYRKMINDILDKLPDVKVVSHATNGKIALSKIELLKPDLITLDVEMPEMNGIELLRELKKKEINTKAIMLSTTTDKGTKMTIEALSLGAFDFIKKPDFNSIEKNIIALKVLLESKIKAFKLALNYKKKSIIDNKKIKISKKNKIDFAADLAVLGISTGGPNALLKMIPMLSENFKIPMLIVQHMPKIFTRQLADSINDKSNLHVTEAKDKEYLEKGKIYIAPGGMQMKLQGNLIRIVDDPPEMFCKPSVNYLFRSVANYYHGNVLAIIMTGMGNDGTLGLKLLKRKGALIISQDEASCIVPGMTSSAIESGVVDIVVPLEKLAEEISKYC